MTISLKRIGPNQIEIKSLNGKVVISESKLKVETDGSRVIFQTHEESKSVINMAIVSR